jgi:hypothetical protein
VEEKVVMVVEWWLEKLVRVEKENEHVREKKRGKREKKFYDFFCEFWKNDW